MEKQDKNYNWLWIAIPIAFVVLFLIPIDIDCSVGDLKRVDSSQYDTVNAVTYSQSGRTVVFEVPTQNKPLYFKVDFEDVDEFRMGAKAVMKVDANFVPGKSGNNSMVASMPKKGHIIDIVLRICNIQPASIYYGKIVSTSYTAY